MRYRVISKKKKILYIHFHNFVDYTSIISNVSYRCISRARHVFVPLLKSPLKIERTKQPGQWTTGKFSSVTRINKTTVKIYREAGSNANSFSFASGKFAERSVFYGGGMKGKFVGGGIVGRYADTSSRNHFRLSEKPSVIKMTPADKSNSTEEEK